VFGKVNFPLAVREVPIKIHPISKQNFLIGLSGK
jgi:hypothetical protein